MATPKDDLRKEIESAFRKVYEDLKKNSRNRNVKNREQAATYALREITTNLHGTGLRGDPEKPWSKMTTLDLSEQVTLWCLETQLKDIFPSEEL